MAWGASSFVNNGVFKVLGKQDLLLRKFGRNFPRSAGLYPCFWSMPRAKLGRELPNWSSGSTSWRPGSIAIPATLLNLPRKTRPRPPETERKRADANRAVKKEPGKLSKAWVAILTGRFRQSRRQVVELLRELCGVSVSLGSIQGLCEETSEALAVPCREAKETVARAGMAHPDEKGWKEKGKRHWLWAAATRLTTVFPVSCSRGRKGLLELMGEALPP